MADHNMLGKNGEDAAVSYLKSQGYHVLHTNWRHGRYELDIVAETADELVIVEVKTRSGNSLMDPEDSVDQRKIRNIVFAADCYIRLYNIDLPARFDIISVLGSHPDFKIDHIQDAFYPPLNTYR
ncbi:MAG: YraN family protein [Dysgonamonadaceae bacterium]|jgi:putative endonuclease|nr:YraN family protein [Dysgonamonadaceae bacterium]